MNGLELQLLLSCDKGKVWKQKNVNLWKCTPFFCVFHNIIFWVKKKQYFCSLYHYVTKAEWRQCTQEFIAPSLPTLNSSALKRGKVSIKFRGWQWQKVKQTCSNWTGKAFWTSCRLNVIYIWQIISLRPILSTIVFAIYVFLIDNEKYNIDILSNTSQKKHLKKIFPRTLP